CSAPGCGAATVVKPATIGAKPAVLKPAKAPLKRRRWLPPLAILVLGGSMAAAALVATMTELPKHEVAGTKLTRPSMPPTEKPPAPDTSEPPPSPATPAPPVEKPPAPVPPPEPATDGPWGRCELLRTAKALASSPGDEDGWKRLLGLTLAVKKEAEREAERQVYEKGRLDLPKKVLELPLASAGVHDTLVGMRCAGVTPRSVISGSFVVVDGDLALKGRGYILRSVVIVTGNLSTDGYINDSIVIAGGAIKCAMHVRSSVVLAQGGVESAHSYALGSIVRGPLALDGYVESCVVFGEVRQRSPDLRGAESRPSEELDCFIRNLREPDLGALADLDPPRKAGAHLARAIKVALVKIEKPSVADARKRLESLGAKVTEVAPDAPLAKFLEHDVVDFPAEWGQCEGLGELAETYRGVLAKGRGIMFSKPGGGDRSLSLLPHPLKVLGRPLIGDHATRAYTQGKPHPLAEGLVDGDLPYPHDVITEEDEHWTVLARAKEQKYATLLVSEDTGRVVLHTAWDNYGDSIPTDRYFVRALTWLAGDELK
ncbi:hypothetical protein HY251_17215, partial [bacterium]|nr:hypothetical protein [bacterium]